MKTGFNDLLQRIQNDSQMQETGCAHLQEIQPVTPSSTTGCQACLESGAVWVRLRICLTCGHVGCCDQSTNQHARQHYNQTRHPIILSYEPRELWMYCYPDDHIYIAPE